MWSRWTNPYLNYKLSFLPTIDGLRYRRFYAGFEKLKKDMTATNGTSSTFV